MSAMKSDPTIRLLKECKLGMKGDTVRYDDANYEEAEKLVEKGEAEYIISKNHRQIIKKIADMPTGIDAYNDIKQLFLSIADQPNAIKEYAVGAVKKHTGLTKEQIRQIRKEAEELQLKFERYLLEIERSNEQTDFDASCSRAAEQYRLAPKGAKQSALLSWLIPAIREEYKAFFGTDKRMYVYEKGAYRNDGIQIVTPRLQNHPELMSILSTNNYNELLNRLSRMTITALKDIKAPENLLCLENGILDLNDLKIIDHDPKYKFVSRIPIKYDPEAKCPKIEQFIAETLGEDHITTFYELAGHVLSRQYYPHNAIMLLGAGRNGKGVFLRILSNWIGQENTSSLTIHDLNERFSKAALFGKHLNVSGDLDSRLLKRTGMFKQLTGQDLVTAEFKGKDPFQFQNYATMVFAANQLPPTLDRSDGFMRRWLILEFNRQFEGENDNPNIDREIIEDPQEFSGLLNRAIEGLKRLKEQGSFSVTESISSTRERYLRLSDPIRTFFSERLEPDEEFKDVPKPKIYNAYTRFCAEEKVPALGDNEFFKRLYRICSTEGWVLEDAKPTIAGRRVSCLRGLKICDPSIELKKSPDSPDSPDHSDEKSTLTTAYPSPDRALTALTAYEKSPDSPDSPDRYSLDGAVKAVKAVKGKSNFAGVENESVRDTIENLDQGDGIGLSELLEHHDQSEIDKACETGSIYEFKAGRFKVLG